MHRDAGHEIASQLVRYELTVARYELCRVGVAGILSGLLRGQVRELLGYQVMILRESLELLMRLLKLLLRLLQQRRIDLLGIRLRLLPSSNGPVVARDVASSTLAAVIGRSFARRSWASAAGNRTRCSRKGWRWGPPENLAGRMLAGRMLAGRTLAGRTLLEENRIPPVDSQSLPVDNRGFLENRSYLADKTCWPPLTG